MVRLICISPHWSRPCPICHMVTKDWNGSGHLDIQKATWIVAFEKLRISLFVFVFPGIPTTIKTMGVDITTIVYLRVLIIQIGSTIILMVVEAQGFCV